MSADDPQSAIANTLFPPPPVYYKSFTKENIERFKELKQLAGQDGLPTDITRAEGSTGNFVSSGLYTEELDRLRSELEKPRADWVEEEGRWMCFGELLSVSCNRPTYIRVETQS